MGTPPANSLKLFIPQASEDCASFFPLHHKACRNVHILQNCGILNAFLLLSMWGEIGLEEGGTQARTLGTPQYAKLAYSHAH